METNRLDFVNKHRVSLLKQYNYTCQQCFIVGKQLQIHHKIPVFENKNLAFELTNLIPLCVDCHRKLHNQCGHPKIWNNTKRPRNNMTVKWVEIKRLKYVGNQETYDLEVEDENHNYVANGIVCHNSQRYAKVDKSMFVSEPVETRLQDTKNRQNSTQTDDSSLIALFNLYQEEHKQKAMIDYQSLIDMGVAKEQARVILPEGLTMSRMYMGGTLRSWIHYCLLRSGNGTQKEHQDIAKDCSKIIVKEFPSLAGIFNSCEINGLAKIERND